MASFTYPPIEPNPDPSPLSPTVPLNPPMVGEASPFDHVDGQNRDLVLESIRSWVRNQLRGWTTAWQDYLIYWLALVTTWINGFNTAAEAYITEYAIAGYSWRTTNTPINPSGTTEVVINDVDPTRPLAIGDLVLGISTAQDAPTYYAEITSIIDTSHVIVTYLGYFQGLPGNGWWTTTTTIAHTGTTNVVLTATESRTVQIGDLVLDNTPAGAYGEVTVVTDPTHVTVLFVGTLQGPVGPAGPGRGVDVTLYGAVGDGVHDDTSAIQAALNYAQSLVELPPPAPFNGAMVYFPRGKYLISSTLNVTSSNIILEGESSASAIIFAPNASFDLVSFNGGGTSLNYAGVRQLRFSTPGNATAGYHLRVQQCVYFIADDILFNGWFGGLIVSDGGVCMFSHLIFSEEDRTSGTNGIGIYIDSTPSYCADLHFTDIQIAETLSSSNIVAWEVTSVDGLYMENCHIHGQFLVSPSGTGLQTTVRSIEMVNCYFDASLDACLNLSGAPSNAYADIRLVNCYFRAGVSGIKVSATVAVVGVQITNCRFDSNSADGIQLLSSSLTTDWIIANCVFSGNNTNNVVSEGDISIQGTANNIMISDCTFVGGGNPGVGVGIGATAQNIILNNLNLIASTAQFIISIAVGALVYYKGLLGYVVKNKGTLTLTAATTQTITHGMSVTPTLPAIRLNVNGVTPAWYITAITSTTFEVVFASAPTAGVLMGWAIDMEY